MWVREEREGANGAGDEKEKAHFFRDCFLIWVAADW
jgi:hypothetical protein